LLICRNWGCVKSKTITLRIVLGSAVVVGEDANNGRRFNMPLIINSLFGICRCWRPRQQQRRSGIAEEMDGILAYDITPREHLLRVN